MKQIGSVRKFFPLHTFVVFGNVQESYIYNRKPYFILQFKKKISKYTTIQSGLNSVSILQKKNWMMMAMQKIPSLSCCTISTFIQETKEKKDVAISQDDL